MTRASLLLSMPILCIAAGCIGKTPANPAATQPVTSIDPFQAEPAYWLGQPPSAQVTADDFNTLFETCEAVARSYLFTLDRRDYRSGLLTTEPAVSKQFFEFWRDDATSSADVAESSLGPIRRTIHFQFQQNLDGSYTVAPKVLVERRSRIDPKYRPTMQDEPVTYWYALRRDTRLEKQLADVIRRKLKSG